MLLVLAQAGVATACRCQDEGEARSESVSMQGERAEPDAAVSAPEPPPAASGRKEHEAVTDGVCQDGMLRIPGGSFWMGSKEGAFSPDESPRFRTEVATFCMQATETTVAEYRACVEAGACESAGRPRVLCNYGRTGRDQHPVNCLTWHQAAAYCRHRGARLPTELEWEYAARGGKRELKYPWGDASPDGRSCWKRARSCEVGSFPPGAFGLYDMSGNLWEWTENWYAPYPWPTPSGSAKVYRGGSFSRRFEKWLHTRLRNRYAPHKWGAHLGFRCALNPEWARCPFAKSSASGRCIHGVLELECPEGTAFNGIRCAKPGAPLCPEGQSQRAGFGCVAGHDPPAAADAPGLAGATTPIERARSPEFDADCAHYQPTRPRAFRYAGGVHESRTHAVLQDGCKNRDVAVGMNSACCP